MKKGLDYSDYIKIFKEAGLTKDEWKEVLKIAIETRKFEIELYWKRANYFWLFVGVFFVAYYNTLPDGEVCAGEKMQQLDFPLENLLFIFGGYCFSVGWFLANRGSKYWQENWEDHIAALSYYLGMPIFEILKSNHSKYWKLTSSYPYSVSRINHTLNIAVIFIWAILLLYRIFAITGEDNCWRGAFFALLSLIGMVLIFCAMHVFSRSFVVREPADHSKEFFDNIKYKH